MANCVLNIRDEYVIFASLTTSLQFEFQVLENSPVGTIVGKVEVVDPDNKHQERHSFNCVVESRDEDFKVSPFTIDDKDNLIVSDPSNINYEFIPFHNIRVSYSELILQ